MPPEMALSSTLNGSNYPCFELIFIVLKVFKPSMFDCIHICKYRMEVFLLAFQHASSNICILCFCMLLLPFSI